MLPIPKGPKYQDGTKHGFCSSNFPYGLGKYSPYGYLGPFGNLVSPYRSPFERNPEFNATLRSRLVADGVECKNPQLGSVAATDIDG